MNDINKIRQYMPQAVYKQIECGQGPSWRPSTEAAVCQLNSLQNIQKIEESSYHCLSGILQVAMKIYKVVSLFVGLKF